jgi:Uma2 family endonuclease
MSLGPGRLTFAEFLAYEAAQEEKHEFVDGGVVDFTAGDLRHALIVTNVLAALHAALDPPLAALGSDVIVATPHGGRHADAVVVRWDEEQPGRIVRAPVALFEVLSDTTSVIDLTVKVPEYASISALQEIALVDSRKRWRQTLRREGHDWRYDVPRVAGALTLASIGVTIVLDAIYAKTGVTGR